MTDQLIIPITYEEMSQEMKGDIEKLSQIVQPVTEAEENINLLLSRIKTSGYLVFLQGASGIGKSTFISSLKWRSHIRKREIVNIDSTAIIINGGLANLFREITKVTSSAVKESDVGPTIVVIDYMESIQDYEPTEIKGFFRNLNGFLRKTPLLIIWPVTSSEETQVIIDSAKIISTTLFHPGSERIMFQGPPISSYIDIAKRTITYLNSGKEPSEFGITHDTFEEVKIKFEEIPATQKTIRRYLLFIKAEWERVNEYQQRLKLNIPKPIEVWFIFSYPDAESVVSQFSRKGQTVDETWTPFHDKLYEYIPQSQRSAIWNASRLQLALFGYIKTRIMFLPTNALVSTLYAYCTDQRVIDVIEKHGPPVHWKKKYNAKVFLKSTPLFGQLVGDKFQVGFRKGGPVAKARAIAAPIFTDLNRLITKGGLSDTVYSKAIAECLNESIQMSIKSQVQHPWLKKIIPDILCDATEKTISLEFHYTDDNAPYKVADYVLNKLNTYMNQIEEITV